MSSELSQAIVLTSGGSKTSIVRTIHPSIQHDTRTNCAPADDVVTSSRRSRRRRPQHLKFSHHTPGGLREVL